jgi:hypothetical protein
MKGLPMRAIHQKSIRMLSREAMKYQTETEDFRQENWWAKLALTCFFKSTDHLHLTESLGRTIHHLHWIANLLLEVQRGIRVNLSRELPQMLEAEQDRGWHSIVPLDEL